MPHCSLRLGDPVGPGLDEQSLIITLRLDGHEYRNADSQDDFEEALHDIQRRLPGGARIKACVACAWSDYSPGGPPLMAGPARFRDARDLCRRRDGKQGPHGIFGLRQERTEFARETWLCEEFEHRTSDRGYRGPFPRRGPL
ncbi:DUF6304 family protein, partial [Streptomyces viridochromogenes]|uniref:DUF6304 family protein n=1 Tax=Streptomyces viridochromogenes TaxID=1938 RepID=UPI001F1B5D43